MKSNETGTMGNHGIVSHLETGSVRDSAAKHQVVARGSLIYRG